MWTKTWIDSHDAVTMGDMVVMRTSMQRAHGTASRLLVIARVR